MPPHQIPFCPVTLTCLSKTINRQNEQAGLLLVIKLNLKYSLIPRNAHKDSTGLSLGHFAGNSVEKDDCTGTLKSQTLLLQAGTILSAYDMAA